MATQTDVSRRGEIRFKQESTANEAIATPSTYWASSPKKVKAWDVKPGNVRPAEDDPSLVNHSMEDRARLLLGKLPSLEFTTWLTGLSVTTPAQDDLGLLLKGALGGESLGPASTTVSGANAGAGATVGLTVTSSAGMAAGQAVKVVSTSRTEMRRIVSIAANVLTLDQDLAGIYTSGTVYGSATYYPDPEPITDLNDAGHLTFAALFLGGPASEQVQHRGCFASFELADIGANKRPKLNWKLSGQDWDYVASVAGLSVFSEPASPNQVNAGLYLNPQGTVTNNIELTSEIDIKIGLSLEAIMSPNGENGIIGHIAGIAGRTSLEFTTPFSVSKWFDRYEAGTKLVGGYALGNNVLISFPQLTIDEAPEAQGSGNQPRSVRVKTHADNGPITTNDLTLARFAIHRFGGP